MFSKFLRTFTRMPLFLMGGVALAMVFPHTRWAGGRDVSMATWGFGNAMVWEYEPWRLYTSAIVHMDLGHALGNALLWLLMCVFARKMGVLTAALWALASAWPITTLCLVLWKQPLMVLGASGVLYAFWAVLTVLALNHAKYWKIAIAPGLCLLAKLVLDGAWAAPVRYTPDMTWPVVQAIHLSGAIVGASIGLLMVVLVRLLRRPTGEPIQA